MTRLCAGDRALAGQGLALVAWRARARGARRALRHCFDPEDGWSVHGAGGSGFGPVKVHWESWSELCLGVLGHEVGDSRLTGGSSPSAMWRRLVLLALSHGVTAGVGGFADIVSAVPEIRLPGLLHRGSTRHHCRGRTTRHPGRRPAHQAGRLRPRPNLLRLAGTGERAASPTSPSEPSLSCDPRASPSPRWLRA